MEIKDMKTLCQLYKSLPEIYKDKVMIVHRVKDAWEKIYANDFVNRINKIAMGLDAMGLKKGDKVCLMSDTRYEWTMIDFAMIILGIINVPVYPTLTGDQAMYIINHSESKALIVENKKIWKLFNSHKKELEPIKCMVIEGESIKEDNLVSITELEEIGKENLNKKGMSLIESTINSIQETELASILYTSGTTGIPKGVMLSHKNFVSNAYGAFKKLDLDKHDTILVFLPLSHSFSRTCTYGVIMGGETLWFAEKVTTLGRDMVDSKMSTLLTVPRVFENVYNKIISGINDKGGISKAIFQWAKKIAEKFIMRQQENKPISIFLKLKHSIADKLVYKKIREKTGGKLEMVISGSSALPKHISYFFNGIGVPLYEGYGLTEATPVVSTNTPEKNKIGTVGTPFFNVEAKLDDDGELLVRGPNIMMGYYKDEASTKEAITSDGWLRTGDICDIDSEGFIKIIERKKELFKSSGGKFIAPQRIESLAKTNSYISEIVIIAENRKFVSAIILPNFEQLKKYANNEKIVFENEENLIEKEEIKKFYRKVIDEEINPHLAAFEIIKRFILTSTPFTIENGQLTPTFKIKRKAVNEFYKEKIARLYGKDEESNND